MSSTLPRMRSDLDIIPFQARGQELFAIRDRLGLIEQPLAVNRDTLGVLALLDGRRGLEELQLILTRQNGGVLVRQEEIERIVSALDEALLLETERYRQTRRNLEERFFRSTVRRAVLAGQSYPEDPHALRVYLARLVSPDKRFRIRTRLVGIVAPHIDIKVAETAYGCVYSCLLGQTPRRVLLIGTGHNLEEGAFCVTEKDFETPLGRVPTDRDAVRMLKEAGRTAVASSDFAHWREHSLEIQLVFLQYALGHSRFTLLPILCGSVLPHLLRGTRFGRVPGESDFAEKVKAYAESPDTLIVAGVDLAHIGPKFGDAQPASALEDAARTEDERLLRAVTQRDGDAFWNALRETNDRYHVCGASTLALLMEILPQCAGRILHYDRWKESATRSAVSFASLLFTAA